MSQHIEHMILQLKKLNFITTKQERNKYVKFHLVLKDKIITFLCKVWTNKLFVVVFEIEIILLTEQKKKIKTWQFVAVGYYFYVMKNQHSFYTIPTTIVVYITWNQIKIDL